MQALQALRQCVSPLHAKPLVAAQSLANSVHGCQCPTASLQSAKPVADLLHIAAMSNTSTPTSCRPMQCRRLSMSPRRLPSIYVAKCQATALSAQSCQCKTCSSAYTSTSPSQSGCMLAHGKGSELLHLHVHESSEDVLQPVECASATLTLAAHLP